MVSVKRGDKTEVVTFGRVEDLGAETPGGNTTVEKAAKPVSLQGAV